MLEAVRSEIEEVHAFIAAWFRGDVAQDDALYEARLAGRMAQSMVNIQPSGEVLTHADLVGGIRAGYGANPAFQIRISDVVVRSEAQGRVLATYVEHQTGARNSKADNRRISSVWFDEKADGALTWLHIHETWCD